MSKYKEKMGDILNKIKGNKRILYLMIISIFVLFTAALNITFSLMTQNIDKNQANITIGKLKYNIQVNNGALEDRILRIPKNDTRIFTVLLTSLNEIDTKYELIYHVCKDVNCNESEYIDKPNELDVLVTSKTINKIAGDIKKEESISISIAGTNETSDDYYIKLDLNVGYTHNELALIKQITKTYYEDDVTIISYVDGEESTEFPASGNYGILYECMVNGTADNDVIVNGVWDTSDENNYHWKIDVTGVTKSKTICNVTFVSKTLNSIKVTNNPTKMYYEPGETFDKTGMVVAGYFEQDGMEASVELSGYTVSPTTINPGATKLTITYMDGDLPLTTTLDVYIKPKLTIDFNGGTGTDVSGYYMPGETISLGVATKSGTTFAGWEVVSGDITINNNSFVMGTTDVSVRALFQQTWNFGYTGGEQVFTAPYSGTYKVYTWGAAGGYRAGYGGYSTGNIYLTKGEVLYVIVGGAGAQGRTSAAGGYNGGGSGGAAINNKTTGGGGGATHIAFKSGLLSSLSSSIDKILIVSGGGGSGGYEEYNGSVYTNGGSGGGYIGGGGSSSSDSTGGGGGTQSGVGSGFANTGAFGKGSSANGDGSGGGGGFYGGGDGQWVAGSGGGSGYIGNARLTNKVMYCYSCSASSAAATKTVSTSCSSSTPTENCAKQGSGYARITFVSIN